MSDIEEDVDAVVQRLTEEPDDIVADVKIGPTTMPLTRAQAEGYNARSIRKSIAVGNLTVKEPFTTKDGIRFSIYDGMSKDLNEIRLGGKHIAPDGKEVITPEEYLAMNLRKPGRDEVLRMNCASILRLLGVLPPQRAPMIDGLALFQAVFLPARGQHRSLRGASSASAVGFVSGSGLD